MWSVASETSLRVLLDNTLARILDTASRRPLAALCRPRTRLELIAVAKAPINDVKGRRPVLQVTSTDRPAERSEPAKQQTALLQPLVAPVRRLGRDADGPNGREA